MWDLAHGLIPCRNKCLAAVPPLPEGRTLPPLHPGSNSTSLFIFSTKAIHPYSMEEGSGCEGGQGVPSVTQEGEVYFLPGI